MWTTEEIPLFGRFGTASANRQGRYVCYGPWNSAFVVMIIGRDMEVDERTWMITPEFPLNSTVKLRYPTLPTPTCHPRNLQKPNVSNRREDRRWRKSRSHLKYAKKKNLGGEGNPSFKVADCSVIIRRRIWCWLHRTRC